MKNIFILLFFCTYCRTSHSQILNINIKNVDTVMLIILGSTKKDTLFTNNGAIKYNRSINYPELLKFIFVKNDESIKAIQEGNERKMASKDDGKLIEAFVGSGSLLIKTEFENLSIAKVELSDSSLQHLYNEFKKRFDPLVQVARTIIDSSYSRRFKNDTTAKQVFNMLYKSVIQIENSVTEKFILENKNNMVGAYILFRYYQIDNPYKADSIYKLFRKELYVSSYLKEIKKRIDASLSLKKGQAAPVFKSISHNNKEVDISLLKGKYIILDFWGSWCNPCIKGIPKMKSLYSNYQNQLEIIGVACNDSDSAWRSAIDKYQLSWPQIFNSADSNDLEVMFNIKAYPTKIIIDPDGKYVASFVGENDGFYKAIEELVKEK